MDFTLLIIKRLMQTGKWLKFVEHIFITAMSDIYTIYNFKVGHTRKNELLLDKDT